MGPDVAVIDPVPSELIGRAPGAPFYPAFDGLRGIAVLMVFLCHFGYAFWPTDTFFWGFTGVDLFFVLSGFLITGILFRTRHRAHYFSTFYWRRTLRIFPLYYAFWLAVFATAWITRPIWHWQALLFAVYLGNLVPLSAANPAYSIFLGIGHGYTSINIAHFWTLCVEEQFYLTWPLVVWLCRGRDRAVLMTLGIAGALFVLGLRTFLYFHVSPALLEANLLYGATYTRADSLLIGAVLNLWLTGAPRRLRPVGLWLVFAPLAVLVLSMTTIGRRWPLTSYHPLLTTYGFTLIALVCCGVVVLTVENTMAWTRLLRWRPLAGLGTISYGFYLLHNLLAYSWSKLLTRLRPSGLGFLVPIAAFAVTYLVAQLSYRYLETPFLRLKERHRT